MEVGGSQFIRMSWDWIMHQLVYNYKNNIDLSPCQSNRDWEIEIWGLIMEFVVELSDVGTATKYWL
jgi:hypothetical protein